MKLLPLMDRIGDTRAWVDRHSGWISDLTGNVFAFVKFYGVFSRTGAQIGWFGDGYIQDRLGCVVLFISGKRIEHLVMPSPRRIPRPPRLLQLPADHPTLRWLLWPPRKKPLWGDFATFYDGLRPSGTAVGNLREFQERAGGR